jgi:hypothetical protein
MLNCFFSLIPYPMRPVWTKILSLRTQPYFTGIFFLSQLWRSLTSRVQKRLRSLRKIFSISGVLIKTGKFQKILIKDSNVKCYENLRGGSRTDTYSRADITKLTVVARERAYKLIYQGEPCWGMTTISYWNWLFNSLFPNSFHWAEMYTDSGTQPSCGYRGESSRVRKPFAST